MNIFGIKNAKYIEDTNTIIDLVLETDEGDLPFTYNPIDDAPATEYVREKMGTFPIAIYEPPPPPTLYELKAAKRAEIASARWSEMVQPTMVAGCTSLWFADKESLNDMLRASSDLQMAIALGYLPENSTVQWKTADGTFATIGLDDLITIRLLLSQRQQGLYAKEAMLVSQIDDPAVTEEDLKWIAW